MLALALPIRRAAIFGTLLPLLVLTSDPHLHEVRADFFREGLLGRHTHEHAQGFRADQRREKNQDEQSQ